MKGILLASALISLSAAAIVQEQLQHTPYLLTSDKLRSSFMQAGDTN
jgi:gamma-glutamyl hydrolase